MHTFFILLGAAVIAYRVFVKGESIFVKNPNWKMRGLVCLVAGLSFVALIVWSLIVFYRDNIPIPSILWIALAGFVFMIVGSVRMMMRVSLSAPVIKGPLNR
jgi:hypothetical protein